MKKIHLPHFLKFKTSKNLVRIGKENDGGYLVCLNDILCSDLLVSFGINDDWSFEKHFSTLNDVRIYAVDASIGKAQFFRKFIKEFILLRGPRVLFKNIKSYIDYLNFFDGVKHIHYKKFIAFDAPPVYSGLKSFLNFVEDSDRIFFKIDIEGSEYRILDDLISIQGRIVSLVIEFHDCDIHIDAIKQFIEKFQIPVVHIHANNYAPVHSSNGVPLVLEITFSRCSDLNDCFSLPHKFDMPNNPKSDEILLSFA